MTKPTAGRRDGMRILAAVAAVALLLLARPAAAAIPDGPSADTPPPPKVGAASAMLLDAATGTVLWEKNAYQHRPMASTTKIMTALLLVEHARMTDVVPISDHALRT